MLIPPSVRPLTGKIRLPGDKSLSHRALMLASIAQGTSRIFGLNPGHDVAATQQALKAVGVPLHKDKDTHIIQGRGGRSFISPAHLLDLGNSGTSARLLTGLFAAHPLCLTLTGDTSLCTRPMERIAVPLRLMGAQIGLSTHNTLPLSLQGCSLVPLDYHLPVASAQIKSALLLAAAQTQGRSRIVEKAPTRDHTERLLRLMGAHLYTQGLSIEILGGKPLSPLSGSIPGDPSAAAFWAAACTLIPGSCITLPTVLWNPRRHHFFHILKDMGASLTLVPSSLTTLEDAMDITIRAAAPLKAIDLPAERVPDLIDEYPILSILAACAEGQSRFSGLSELRYKESDRLTAIISGLTACGVAAHLEGDDLVIRGQSSIPGGASIHAHQDHRIAMAFSILSAVTQHPLIIQGLESIDSSDPYFLPQWELQSRRT